MADRADERPFLPRVAMWTLGLAAAVSALCLLVSGGPMALGVALGALLGLANLWLLSRAISGALANAREHRPSPGQKWALPGVFLLKWPFLLLALGLILWYLPARPEGVGIGIGLSLLAAALAATRGSKAAPRDPSGPS
jgi:hypothetical protein